MENLDYLGPYVGYMIQKKQLAPSLICAYAQISLLEYNTILKGKVEPHPNTLKKICDFMEIDFLSLFKRQDYYQKLLDEAFHSLTYDRMEEQKKLMEKVNKIDCETSILFPEFLLLKIMNMGMNEPANEELATLLEILSHFLHVLKSDHQGIYYIYKGCFYRERGDYKACEKCYHAAEKLPSFRYREILYQHLGGFAYYQNRYVDAFRYYNRAYEIYEKKWNINRLLYTTCSIAFCYIGMRSYQLAIDTLLEALRLARQNKNDFVILLCYEDLCYAYFLIRDYKNCIVFGQKAVTAKSTYDCQYVFIAYSYARLKNYKESRNWIQKRDSLHPTSFSYEALSYTKMVLEQDEIDAEALKALYHKLPESLKEMKLLMLEDLATYYHERSDLQKENEILLNIIDIIK